MVLDSLVAKASPELQSLTVAQQQRPAPGLQDAFRLEDFDDAADIAAAYPKQGRKLLMRQRQNFIVIGPFHRRQDPFRSALLDGMDRVAGRRLEYLGEHAISIAGKH